MLLVPFNAFKALTSWEAEMQHSTLFLEKKGGISPSSNSYFIYTKYSYYFRNTTVVNMCMLPTSQIVLFSSTTSAFFPSYHPAHVCLKRTGYFTWSMMENSREFLHHVFVLRLQTSYSYFCKEKRNTSVMLHKIHICFSKFEGEIKSLSSD